MRSFAITISLIVSLLACKKSDDSDSSASDKETFTVTGKVELGDIGEGIATTQDLEVGQALDDATIFIKDFPDQSTTSDESGVFTLQVNTDEAALLASEFTILMWYTKEGGEDETAVARFGMNKKIEPTLGDDEALDLGTLDLTFTMGLHLSVRDEDTNGIEGCSVTIDGLDDHLKSVDQGSGNYDIDYLPPDTYTINVECEGYEANSTDFEVTEATGLDQWLVVDPMTMEATTNEM